MASKGSIIVTGANGGLGSALVKHIIDDKHLASNYTGIYTVRKADTAQQLHSALGSAAPTTTTTTHKHVIQEIDLASMASVKRVAADINAKVASGEMPPIRALILNAAFQEWTGLTLSDDGFDTTWQVNYLSNMLLTLFLLQSMDKEHGRIAIVASFSHDIKDPRNKSLGAYKDPRYPILFPADIQDLARGKWSTPAEDPSMMSGFRRYGASKLCALMFMVELANRLAKDPKLNNITLVGVDPGAMPTNLTRRMPLVMGLIIKLVMSILARIMVIFSANAPARSTWQSAADIMRACFEVDSIKGQVMYLDGTKPWPLGEATQDEEKRKLLWEYGLEVAGMEEGETALANWK